MLYPDKETRGMSSPLPCDFEGHQTYTEKPGHNFALNKTFAEVRASYDAVYCAGGRGPEYIRTDKRVQAMVRHFHEEKKPIFTICHGVQILVAVDGVVRGKRSRALGACEPEVALAGGVTSTSSQTEAWWTGRWCRRKDGPRSRLSSASASRFSAPKFGTARRLARFKPTAAGRQRMTRGGVMIYELRVYRCPSGTGCRLY